MEKCDGHKISCSVNRDAGNAPACRNGGAITLSSDERCRYHGLPLASISNQSSDLHRDTPRVHRILFKLLRYRYSVPDYRIIAVSIFFTLVYIFAQ